MGQPVDLGHPGVELGDGRARGRDQRPRLLETQAQAGEGGAQLMRRVGDEVLLAAQEPGHPTGHVVEGPRERALLGAALDRSARLEVASGHPPHRPVEAAHRARDRARDDQPRDQPDSEDQHADERQADDRAAHGAVHGGDALGDPHRAHGRRAGRAADRHGGGQQIFAQRVLCRVPWSIRPAREAAISGRRR